MLLHKFIWLKALDARIAKIEIQKEDVIEERQKMSKIIIILTFVAIVGLCLFLFAWYKVNETQRHINEIDARIEEINSSQK